MSLSLVALVFGIIYSGVAIYEKISPRGKLSMSTIISLISFGLMFITGIAANISQDQGARDDKQELYHKIDSSTQTINQKLDSMKPRTRNRPDSSSGRSATSAR
jgi:hypothetical protein